MNDSQKRISGLIKGCYSYVYYKMVEAHREEYERFIECNRGTYAFVSLISSLNEYLIYDGQLTQNSCVKEQVDCMAPYFDALIEYLCNMPAEEENNIRLAKGAGADTLWLRMYQNAIHKRLPKYNPEGLEGWLETQDKDLQEEGKNCGKQIEKHLKNRILEKLEELYGDTWENQVKSIKGKCLLRMDDTEEIESQDWTDYLILQDFKEIIDSKWNTSKEDSTFVPFSEEFAIQVSDSFRTKTDKMKWLNDLISFSKAWTTTRGRALNRAEVNEMYAILQSISPSDEN